MGDPISSEGIRPTVVVTGGRYLNDKELVWNYLDQFHTEIGIGRLIHGDATGADTLCKEWAIHNGIDHIPCPAEWHIHGKYEAGFIRNQQMIDLYQPEMLISFPGHNGTSDMTKRAKRAGLEHWECTY